MRNNFLIMLICIVSLKTTINYQNPYQTLRVGSYRSLAYINDVYLELVEKFSKTNSSEIREKLFELKRAFIEIKVARQKEETYESLITGLLKVGKQCTMAIIIFYLTLLFLYYLFFILKKFIKVSYAFFIMNIVIFYTLENFFMALIINIKLLHMISFVFSLCIFIIRYYSRKNQVDSNKNYEKFYDEPKS